MRDQSVTTRAVLELQGDDVVNAPAKSGIYAWYYRPRVFYGSGMQSVEASISRFLHTKTSMEAEVEVRYGLRWHCRTDLVVLHGADRKPAASVIADAVNDA